MYDIYYSAGFRGMSNRYCAATAKGARSLSDEEMSDEQVH
jgi:hypothetical protein